MTYNGMRPIDETRKKILLSSFVIIGLLIGLYQFYQYKEKSLYAFGGIHFTDPESIFLTMPTIENELYSTDEDVINDFIAILSNYQAKKIILPSMKNSNNMMAFTCLLLHLIPEASFV